ncbi:hypothetical protein BS78_05G025900 [Paspalum vaginatum]|nr:hypothetical protein BS78_05G025900 [Paspalum vaginatum]
MLGIEGAAVSGMLNVLANKLAPLVMKQYSSIVGVTKDLQNLQDLVEEINHWLEKTGYKATDSSQLFNWLRQLKHVVYDIDDIVDEFHLEAEKHESHGGNQIVSRWLVTKPKSFLLQCKTARKIKTITERFAAIVKQRTDFSAIVNSVPDGLAVPHINRTTRTIPTLPSVDEALVHRRDQEKHEIISKLVDNNNRQIKIVYIIGLGGCGKTTLAKLVFNDDNIIKGHFEVRIWVHVSQNFDVEKLVEKLFEAVSGEKSAHYPLQQMTITISDKLSGKRYLLVLDDVWIEDRLQWEEFIVHINGGAPGSRILLTTRNRKVVEVVESTDPFNLLVLSDVDSWAVFSQSFGTSIKGLDSEFLEVGREIVNKCGGVPLAIKVLAVILRDKRLPEEWKAMRESNLLHVEEKEHRVLACLELSYFHLPSHLKQCFTMCSLFPKGNRIYKRQLIDQWIAHDMINLTPGVNCLEDIGDEQFRSLVQVSFLQDVDEYNGRVTCKMHDLVHDLARSILHDEISINVPDDATSSTKAYRYFYLAEQPRKLLRKQVFHNARAIYVDKGNDIIFGKALKNAKHLRSIIVNFSRSTTMLTAIFQIKNLKYLEMSLLQCEELPEAISDIWTLQALHLTYSDIVELPKSIGKLHKLRKMNLSHCTKLKCLPDSIGECNMLSSLDLCNCKELRSLPNSIGRNEKLKVLRLGYTKIEKLPSSIATLRNLECLDLHYCWEFVEFPDGISNLEKLQVLNLKNCRRLEQLPEGISNLEKLQVLNLENCTGLVKLLEGIGNLEKLQVLNLTNCRGLVELPESIGRLDRLQVLNLENCRRVVELPEGIGNLEKLQVLNVKDCEELRGMPIGIGQLNRLEKLGLFVMGEAKKFAGISELANIGWNSEDLVIRIIARVMELDNAHRTCLK